MPHEAFITVHAVAGAAGLLLGPMALRPPRFADGRTAVRHAYALCLVVLVAAMGGAVAAGWRAAGTAVRLADVGLCLLGGYVLARGLLAWRTARSGLPGGEAYLRHQYFTYVSLWEGFLIVAMINSALPVWMVAMVVVAVPLIGAPLLSRYKRHLAGAAPTPVPDGDRTDNRLADGA